MHTRACHAWCSAQVQAAASVHSSSFHQKTRFTTSPLQIASFSNTFMMDTTVKVSLKKIRTSFGGAPAPLWQPALHLGFWEAPPPPPALKGGVDRHPPTPGCILSWVGLRCPWDSVKMQILMQKSQAGVRGSAFLRSSKLMATMWFRGPLLSALEGCRGLCYCRWSRNPTL